jgi:5-(carboxyamino)imidazole ribonucleotide mutase
LICCIPKVYHARRRDVVSTHVRYSPPAVGVDQSDPDSRERIGDEVVSDEVAPLVGVVMGSSSDWPTMSKAVDVLVEFGVPHETRVVSAHRMPDEMFDYAETASGRGLRAVIAGAGGAAHLPGMLSAKTLVPVLGVPVASRHLSGQDSLLSIVQMPAGIPTATFAIGEAGATNAALFAVAMLAADDRDLRVALDRYRSARRDQAAASVLPPP